MSITFPVTAPELNESTSVTSRGINVPAGVQDGDALLLFLSVATGSVTFTVTAATLTVPITAAAATATQSGHTSQVWKAINIAASDAGKTITIGTGASMKVSGGLVVVRGGGTSEIIDAITSKTAGSTSSPTTPTLVTSAPGVIPVTAVMMARGGTTPNITAMAPPVGITELFDAFTTGTASLSSACAGAGSTPLGDGDTITSQTYSADQSAIYSAWAMSLLPDNIAPTCSAGSNVAQASGTLVSLSGSASDADGSIVSTVWTVVSAPAGDPTPTITDDDTLTPSFTPAVPGTYVLRLTATDDGGATCTSDVTVWSTTTAAGPISVNDAGGWTVVGAADIPAALGDTSDASYAETGDDPSADELSLRLEPMPAGPKTITYRIGMAAASPTGSFTVTLKQGSTTVASQTHTGVTDAIVAGSMVLSPAQNALITDPTALDLVISATV